MVDRPIVDVPDCNAIGPTAELPSLDGELAPAETGGRATRSNWWGTPEAHAAALGDRSRARPPGSIRA